MARQASRGKLNKNGLAGLGLDKLIEILLDEATANKALKVRLQTALAGETGSQEMARLIDKRLDALDQAKTRISAPRARDLATELSGLMRNIQSELGGTDPAAGAERMLRVALLRFAFAGRLIAASARLWKVFDEAEAAALQMISELPESAQAQLVPLFERFRIRDYYGEYTEFLRRLVLQLTPQAGEAWKKALIGLGPKETSSFRVLELLQLLALRQKDFDGFIALEKRKPENRQDTLEAARVLHEAGRHAEALDWVRMRPTGMRLIPMGNLSAAAGPEIGEQDRRLLESEILEKLGQRSGAQDIRWAKFLEAFDPAALKLYLSKLDDFAEFDELDKAFAVVAEAKDIHSALRFFIAWPRLEMAEALIVKHVGRWDGDRDEILIPATDALRHEYPLATTILLRVLIEDILKRGDSEAYLDAVEHVAELAYLSPSLPADPPIEDYQAFIDGLHDKYYKRHGFWRQLPPELAVGGTL